MFHDPDPLPDLFLDRSGVLEGEQLVRSSSIRGKLWSHEQPAIYHDTESPSSRLNYRCLRPIVATPLGDSPIDGTLEDWKVLSRPAPQNVRIHIYGPRRSPGSLVCFMSQVPQTTYTDFCIGYASTASNNRTTRIYRVLHEHKHAR